MVELAKGRGDEPSHICDFVPGDARSRASGAAPGLSITWHSGLPLTLCQGRPITPARKGARAVQLAVKRVLDIVISLVTLLFFAPALLVIALAIRATSPGPSLFRQTREGQDGAPIEIYKFRTIYSERCDTTGLAPVRADDARVTPLGRVLRRTSIDEMPQQRAQGRHVPCGAAPTCLRRLGGRPAL